MESKKKFINLGTSFVSSIIVLFVFSTALGPLPPLGDFLDPTGGGIFGVGQSSSNPNEEIFVSGLEGDIIIHRDNKGIPHIYAEFDNDVFFAVGYLQAQDRLFQLDIQRRLYSGTLSEILGNSTLENDILMRSVGLVRISEKLWETFQTESDPETKNMVEIVNAFTKGVNQYIDEKHPLPFEFQLLGYTPSPWTPIDSIAFSKYMSFVLGYEQYDLAFAEIADNLGAESAYNLFPYESPLQIPIIPDYGGYDLPDKYDFAEGSTNSTLFGHELTKPSNSEDISFSEEVMKGVKNVRKILEDIFTTFGFLLDEFRGSNNWVVSGNRTDTGKPYVANDMHLQWSTPSIWYQMSYHSKESNLNVWGFIFIGSPLIVAGHNENIAWGFTNVGGDVLDWYYYKENDQGQYYHNNSWKNFELRDETIKRKGLDSYNYTVKITTHGSVISGLDYEGADLVASWVGTKDYQSELEKKYVFKAVYGFNFASNFDEFQEAVYLWDGPAQNIVYADETNIAMWVAGVHPIRAPGIDGRLPVNGSSDNVDWVGYISHLDWPKSLNPDQGYLVSANQKSAGPNYLPYISSFHANGYRARQINYMLHIDSTISLTDMKSIQTNTIDTSAEAFVPYLLDALSTLFGAYGDSFPYWDEAVDELQSWDYNMSQKEIAPLIFRFFIDNYRQFTFQDDWNVSGIESKNYPLEIILENLTWKDPNSHWFDNQSTPSIVENSTDILRIAFEEALVELNEEMGEFSNWKYGNWHKGYFEHLTFLKALSSDQVPIDGSRFTVNPSGGKIAKGGASERVIYDLSDLTKSIAALPGGQSGNPTSVHYLDLLYEYFLKWDYYEQHFYLEEESFPTELIESTLIFRRVL